MSRAYVKSGKYKKQPEEEILKKRRELLQDTGNMKRNAQKTITEEEKLKKRTEVIERIKNSLPGVTIGVKTMEMEFRRRDSKKWMPVIEGLSLLESEDTFIIDVTGANKNKINSIRYAIRETAKEMGKNPGLIKFSHDENLNKLHIWVNHGF